MSAALPANRVHLVLAGLPQRNAEPLALNICAALQFAANTFPEFQAFVQTDLAADGFPDGFREALADLTPEFLTQIADMVTAGVVADKSGVAASECGSTFDNGRFTCGRERDHRGWHESYGEVTSHMPTDANWCNDESDQDRRKFHGQRGGDL